MAEGWIGRVRPAASTALACGALAILAVKFLPRRAGLATVQAVAHLVQIPAPSWAWMVVLASVVFGAVAALRCRVEHRPLLSKLLWSAAAMGLAGVALSAHGHHLIMMLLAACLAGLSMQHLTGGHPPAEPVWSSKLSDRAVAGVCFVFVLVVMSAVSMHRHANYGSGSWDHGNMVHNFYRASRFLSTVSPPLSDVDFLGDHFMVGIYIYAPLLWLHSGSATVLLIQSVNLACAAPALYLIARHNQAPKVFALAIALAGGLSFGLQSAAYFDSHEITVGFGFLAVGIWAFETKRFWAATAAFIAFSWFKESLGAYVLALGLLALARAWWGRDKKQALFGLLWVGYGAVWFFLVNRVFMPAFMANGTRLESHETFADFGPTVFAAALGMVTNPVKAAFAVFVPHLKVQSMLTTLLGTGGLAVLSPSIMIAALPLFAERFLSSKATMWEMGYHYAAPLCLYAAWAAGRSYPKLLGFAARLNVAPRHLAFGLAMYVGAAAMLENGFGYRHAANFVQPPPSYFATPAKRAANDRAVALVESAGREAKVSAQNRILPHLADREWVWRLDLWMKADWVVVSAGESAWPWDDGFPRRLAKQLIKDPAWKLVFAEADTAVLVRRSASELPEVEPTAGLR